MARYSDTTPMSPHTLRDFANSIRFLIDALESTAKAMESEGVTHVGVQNFLSAEDAIDKLARFAGGATKGLGVHLALRSIEDLRNSSFHETKKAYESAAAEIVSKELQRRPSSQKVPTSENQEKPKKPGKKTSN